MVNIQLEFCFREMQFRVPARTSRDTLFRKPSWFIRLTDQLTGASAYGECSLIPGLSIDDPERISEILTQLQSNGLSAEMDLTQYAQQPALRFALEMALLSLNKQPFQFFDCPFFNFKAPTPINGLIWMDSGEGMLAQIKDRVDEGFRILKMKVGALDHQEELDMLHAFREAYPSDTYELRVDANGAFTKENALQRLDELAQFNIHSIEQPIKPKQWKVMRDLVQNSPIPIALDEELIGYPDKAAVLDEIHPHYLIIKPSLIGGFHEADEWTHLAEERDIKWWATSALEANIGLNAIAQWCSASGNPLPQGLGTGKLFTNNIPSPLEVKNATIYLNHSEWDLSDLSFD